MSATSAATVPVFNPDARIDRVALPHGEQCLVIDDAFTEPERVREWAIAQRAAFKPVDFNAYPGTFLMAPADLATALADYFVAHLRRFFDARRVIDMHCRFSMVTRPPQTLRPYQWFCHRDNMFVAQGQSIQASVLYLFDDPVLGGTSFYEPAVGPAEFAALHADAARMSGDAFAQKYAIAPTYLTASNRYFTQVASVPARFNRLIFYNGGILHSGDIARPELLSDDPARGRLTFNGFFTSRCNAA